MHVTPDMLVVPRQAALAEPLRQDAPHSIRPQALWSGSEAYRRTWGDLVYSVRR